MPGGTGRLRVCHQRSKKTTFWQIRFALYKLHLHTTPENNVLSSILFIYFLHHVDRLSLSHGSAQTRGLEPIRAASVLICRRISAARFRSPRAPHSLPTQFKVRPALYDSRSYIFMFMKIYVCCPFIAAASD